MFALVHVLSILGARVHLESHLVQHQVLLVYRALHANMLGAAADVEGTAYHWALSWSAAS